MKKGEGSFGGSGYFEVGRFRRMEFKTLSSFSSFHFLLSSHQLPPFSFFIAATLPSTTLDLLLQIPWTHLPLPTSGLSHAVISREESPVTRLTMPNFLSCLLSASLCWRCTNGGGWEMGSSLRSEKCCNAHFYTSPRFSTSRTASFLHVRLGMVEIGRSLMVELSMWGFR